jgi:hypothetical protein
LHYGQTSAASNSKDASAYVFASELKALVGHVDPSTVVAIPPGHCWTLEEGLACHCNPDWLRKVREDYLLFLFLSHVFIPRRKQISCSFLFSILCHVMDSIQHDIDRMTMHRGMNLDMSRLGSRLSSLVSRPRQPISTLVHLLPLLIVVSSLLLIRFQSIPRKMLWIHLVGRRMQQAVK